MYLLNVLKHSI